jgi:membrane protein YqaA with SNARE-associated domain
MQDWLHSLLSLLALPEYGLGTLFVVSFLSATLLPMGSEPALFGLVKLNADLLWPAIAVATVGNTLGGMLDWWLGYGTSRVVDKWKDSRVHVRALDWLERLGPKACLLSWLPLVGDPLCVVAHAVLALRALHDDRQAGALSGDDAGLAVSVPRGDSGAHALSAGRSPHRLRR